MIITNAEIALVAFAAFVGALFSGAIGWLESGEPFDARKFTATLLRAVIAAIGIAIAFNFEQNMNLIDFFLAFGAGMAVDVGGHRLSGAITSALNETSNSDISDIYPALAIISQNIANLTAEIQVINSKIPNIQTAPPTPNTPNANTTTEEPEAAQPP